MVGLLDGERVNMQKILAWTVAGRFLDGIDKIDRIKKVART